MDRSLMIRRDWDPGKGEVRERERERETGATTIAGLAAALGYRLLSVIWL